MHRLWLLTICLCLFLCCGCDTPDTTEQSAPATLTHVYTETIVDVPDGYRFDEFVTQNDDGMVLDLLRSEDGEEGIQIWRSRWQYGDTEPTMLWEYPNESYPRDIIAFAERKYALWTGETAHRLTCTGADGETKTVEKPEAALQISTERVYLQDIHVDGEGLVYLISYDGIILYDRELDFVGVLDRMDIKGWTAQGNTLMVWGKENGRERLVSVEKGKFSEPYPIPQGASWYFLDSDENLYYHTSEGIYRYTTTETADGTVAAGEMLLHYGNSNLYDVAARTIAMLPTGRIFLAYEEWEPGFVTDIPVVMTPAPDVNLADITLLELATSQANAAQILGKAVVQFNKNHPEARLIWTDYSKYNTKEEPVRGEEMLALDMSTGKIRPDIYYGRPGSDGFSLLLKHRNYTDLTPQLADDPVYNLANLSGVVKTTYTVQGKLMALPLYMATETALVSPAFFSDSSTRQGWTVQELLQIANNMPANSMVRSRLTMEDALGSLLGFEWLGLFIDQTDGTCDFDSEDFVGLLDFIRNLPEHTASTRESLENGDNVYVAFQEGRMLTAKSSAVSFAGYVRDKIYGEDRLMIGYPTRDGLSGSVLSTDTELFVVTGTCKDVALAWAFCRDITIGTEISAFTMPIWKSMLSDAAKEAMSAYQFLSYSGSTARSETPITLSPDGTYKGEPGIVARLTAADGEAYIAWLDTVGRPIDRAVIPREVEAIVYEELSRFYAGEGDSVSCADAIQSRVQIWLDENG